MAFLDNSGDIILDAVLTDTGRYRLAKGDGSFRIAKFALGDDEIDYSLFNSSDSRGSAYYDLEILNTPILEAFTDNAASMKSKLLSIPRNDLLFLPVIKLDSISKPKASIAGLNYVYCLLADADTDKIFTGFTGNISRSGLFAYDGGFDGSSIRLDQGLDTTRFSFQNALDPDLKETQYIVEMDNRLMKLATQTNSLNATYLDDDQIASYYVTLSTSDLVSEIGSRAQGDSVIAGPRGTRIDFSLRASTEIQYSTFLFEQIGSDGSFTVNNAGSQNYYYIDTNVRIMGATTGYRVDIPVRVLKKKA